MSAGGGKTPPARAQGWMCVWAGIAPWCGQPQAHDPIVPCSLSPFLMLSPAGHHPEPPHRSPHPGPPVCPKLTMEHQWPSSCRDNCGEPPLLRLIPPWCVGTPGRRRTHNAHAHTHKTNPKSGSVSERINYWLMHIQMRNSAEPGGALGGPAKENSSGEI